MNSKRAKAQAALEYLSTYGLAIIIIAVVLSALYALGVFSPTTFSPLATPGSCTVSRTSGQWTTAYIALTGTCTGLRPQEVMYVQNGIINMSLPIQLNGTGETLSYWVKYSSIPTNVFVYLPVTGVLQGSMGTALSGMMGCAVGNFGPDFSIVATYNTCGWFKTSACGPVTPYCWSDPVLTSVPGANEWYNYILTDDNNGDCYVYVDGARYGSPGDCPTPSSILLNSTTNREGPANITIGIDNNVFAGNFFVADVQLYNTSLSAAQVQGVYASGIGGDPIQLINLAGWWPLNGNLYDYSGNGDNGTAISGIYSFRSNWQGGYSTPTVG